MKRWDQEKFPWGRISDFTFSDFTFQISNVRFHISHFNLHLWFYRIKQTHQLFNLRIDLLRFGNIRQFDTNQILKPKLGFVTLLCDNTYLGIEFCIGACTGCNPEICSHGGWNPNDLIHARADDPGNLFIFQESIKCCCQLNGSITQLVVKFWCVLIFQYIQPFCG